MLANLLEGLQARMCYLIRRFLVRLVALTTPFDSIVWGRAEKHVLAIKPSNTQLVQLVQCERCLRYADAVASEYCPNCDAKLPLLEELDESDQSFGLAGLFRCSWLRAR